MPYECRICFDEDEDDTNMIVPCKCKGSSKYIHRQCLDTWRAQNPEGDNFKRCNQCRFVYIIDHGPEFDREKAHHTYSKRIKTEKYIVYGTILFALVVTMYILYMFNLVNYIPFNWFKSRYILTYFLLAVLILSLLSGYFCNHGYNTTGDFQGTMLAGALHIYNMTSEDLRMKQQYYYSQLYMEDVSRQQSVRDFKGNESELNNY